MKIKYYQRPDRPGIWMEFRDGAGKRQRISTGYLNEAAAVKATPALLATFFSSSPKSGTVVKEEQSPVGTPAASGWTLQRAFEAASRDREDWLMSKSFKSIKQTFDKVAEYWGKDTDLSTCTRKAVLEWRTALLASPGKREGSTLSNSTINHRLSMLATLLEVADLPPHTVKHLSVKQSRRKRRARDEEVKAVISWLQANSGRKSAVSFADLIQVALETTARQGELLALIWADVYFDRGIVCFRDTKNGDMREVPMSDVVLRVLERRRAYGQPGPFSDLNSDRCTALWDYARDAIGLGDDPEFVFHVATRHEGLSRLAEANVSAFQIMAMAGHKSIQTSDRYVKKNVESLRSVVNLISR